MIAICFLYWLLQLDSLKPCNALLHHASDKLNVGTYGEQTVCKGFDIADGNQRGNIQFAVICTIIIRPFLSDNVCSG